MDGTYSASSLMQHTKFDIDLEQLGTFLADSFIKRVDAFMAADRVVILTACRARLAAEGGDIQEHLLTGPQPKCPLAPVARSVTEQIVPTPAIL